MTRKVTIIAPAEYEGFVLEALEKSRVVQLKSVKGPEFENLTSSERKLDYGALHQRLNSQYERIIKLTGEDVERIIPGEEELRRFVTDPEGTVDMLLSKLENLIASFNEIEEAHRKENEEIINEFQAAMERENSAFEDARDKIVAEQSRIKEEKEQIEKEITRKFERVKARLESVSALQPEEFKSCFIVGLTKNEVISRLEEYLNIYSDIFYKVVKVTEDESLIYIFGSEDRLEWVESLFLVFEVKDVFDFLNTRDILLVLDPKKRKEIIDRYQEELRKIEEEKARVAEKKREYEANIGDLESKMQSLVESHNQKIDQLKKRCSMRLEQLKEEYAEKIRVLKERQSQLLDNIAFMEFVLRALSDKRVPVFRTGVFSIIQGWTPDHEIPKLERTIEDVESYTGMKFFVQFEKPGPDDRDIPVPEPRIKLSFLQPLWKLTSLRGWPSGLELNPSYITIIVFCFQFGLMFGDIGQGALFFLAGIVLTKKFKRGMVSKLGPLLILMGLSAIIFGVLYNSVFLVEGLLFNHYQVMPNPVHQTTKLMLLVFKIAAIEIIFGLVLGAINQIRAGNPIGALGEHGLGMILYVAGLYLTSIHFIKIGMDFMAALSNWTFYLVIAGMILSFLEPIIHSVVSGHGIGIEVVGEGVGGLLMTFVEGMANIFSFLRIAAFALAHASLAIAAEALTHSLGITGIGLVLMNVIAMSFEFVSSSVQSLRLLYYEFMGKFYEGSGTPFRPFRIKKA